MMRVAARPAHRAGRTEPRASEAAGRCPGWRDRQRSAARKAARPLARRLRAAVAKPVVRALLEVADNVAQRPGHARRNKACLQECPGFLFSGPDLGIGQPPVGQLPTMPGSLFWIQALFDSHTAALRATIPSLRPVEGGGMSSQDTIRSPTKRNRGRLHQLPPEALLRPLFRQPLRLLQHQANGVILFVRRVLVPTQRDAHQIPQSRPHALALLPIDARVAPQLLGQLERNLLQHLVAELKHGALVVSQSIVESKLGLVETQVLAALRRLAQLLGHRNQLFDDQGALDRAAAVAAQCVPQSVAELPLKDDVGAAA
jgi:hypothetical protein